MASSGATNLNDLIKSMNPILEPAIFVYATIPFNSREVLEAIVKQMSGPDIKMLFQEREGWSVVLSMNAAAGLEHTFTCRQITLNIHSSLDAVGFLAAITTRLAKLGVGVNPVSAYFHDHLFVPAEKADVIVEELELMAAERR